MYTIFFTGEAQENITSDQLKINLSKLFKTDLSKIEKMFVGKPVSVKKNVTIDIAKKYQQAMINAGAKVYVKANKIQVDKVQVNKVSPPLEKPVSEQISSGLAGLISYNKNIEEGVVSDNSLLSASTESLEEFSDHEVNFHMPDLEAYSMSEADEGSLEEYTKDVVSQEINDISYLDITDKNDRPLSDQERINNPVEIPNTEHLEMSQAEQGSLEEFAEEVEEFDDSKLPKMELQDSY
jgi:hypothetical protein